MNKKTRLWTAFVTGLTGMVLIVIYADAAVSLGVILCFVAHNLEKHPEDK